MSEEVKKHEKTYNSEHLAVVMQYSAAIKAWKEENPREVPTREDVENFTTSITKWQQQHPKIQRNG